MRIFLRQNETTFKQLFESFLTSCKAKGLKNTTIKSYESHVRCIANYNASIIVILSQEHLQFHKTQAFTLA